MVTRSANSADSFLAEFFGPTNKVDLTTKLNPWIERLMSGAPTLLPARTADNRLRLYGISQSPASARGLAEELLAAIGPSWSTFEGAPASLDPDDPIEAPLIKYVEPFGDVPIYRLDVRDDQAAWKAMDRLRSLWERRPTVRDDVLAPLPDLLRDVELALGTPYIDEAATLIETLRHRGELSSQNLLFLELRLLAAAGRWDEVLRHPRLDDVLQAHRPSGVTLMLLEALDQSLLRPAAEAGDVQEALATYQSRIADRFARLVEVAPDIDSSAALEIRVLAAVASGVERQDVLDLVEAASPEDRPWLAAIAAVALEAPSEAKPESVVTPSEDEVLRLARDAAYSGNHRGVLDLLADVVPTRQSVELLVGAAVGLRTLAAARAVASAYETLSPEEREALANLPLLAPALQRVLRIAGDGQAVDSWHQWLARLSADEQYEAAVDVAEAGAAEWSTTEPASLDEAAAIAAALIGVPYHGRTALERALPYLLGYLDRRPQPDDLSLPIYGAILDVLAYGESRSRAVRETAVNVLSRLLAGAPSADRYAEYLTLVEHMWDDGIRAPTTLGWFADILVAVTHHPCASEVARRALMRRALNDAASWREVDQLAVDLLRVLATDSLYGDDFTAEVNALPEPAREATVTGARPDPESAGPLIIGIYSLSEPATQRAKAVLERRFPQHDVQLNHEHDDSERLRGLARRADIMAVVIASAKHAATDGIRRHCRSSALLEVGTAGSTGLLRAILGRLDEVK